MKLTHTLCAALLLGALSTPALAQSKGKPKAATITKSAPVDTVVNASAKPDCVNAKGVKCSKAERAAAYLKIGDIKGESASAKKPCKNAKDVKCPKAEKAAVYLKIEGIKGESTD